MSATDRCRCSRKEHAGRWCPFVPPSGRMVAGPHSLQGRRRKAAVVAARDVSSAAAADAPFSFEEAHG